VTHYTRCLADQLRPYDITVNCIAPGDTRTGRFVPAATVRRELDTYIDASDDAARALARMLRDREISLADAEILFRREIKRVHLNSVAMARGGWANLTPADYGLAGQRIRYNYGKARDMFAQIAAGKQRLDGTLDQRMSLYVSAGRNTFYRSKHAQFKADGPTHVRSIRHARDSCLECVSLDRKVFAVNDPSYKMPGQRICLTRCRCSEEYLRLGNEGDYLVLEAA